MTFYVLRHADKEAGEFRNPRLPLNDQPISQVGRDQVLALVEYFRDIPIESITVSEYQRTTQTIAGVAVSKELPITVDSRLNEINIGLLEKLEEETIEHEYPDFWQAFLARDRDFTFPNGESGEAAGHRVYELFCSLDASRNHILVAHDGLIRILICRVLGLPTWKRHLFRIELASLTTFEFMPQFNCWAMPGYNISVTSEK